MVDLSITSTSSVTAVQTTARDKVVAVAGVGLPTIVPAPRRLPYVNGAWHRMVVVSATASPAIIMIPEGISDFTIYAIGQQAANVKVSKSIDSAATIVAGTPTWRAVHSSLNSVGATMVRYELGNKLPMALKVETLINASWAKVMLLGKQAP